MQRKRTDIDLMAPVGSYESLMAAIQAGSNSIYFGIEQLNMRARSSNNFTFDDLRKIVSICEEHNVKTYLTVNTIIYDEEMEKMHKVVDAAAENHVTAIIASDIAVMQYARSKGVEVHASTQLNISNIEAVAFFAQFCDVMVTARELSLEQVKYITEQIRQRDIRGPKGELVKIEIFCHGALCMAVSGKCYLSLHEYNHSANRGACLQACRRAYKIEGRARSCEYVKTVVECYDEALNSCFDGTYNREKIDGWKKRLETVFNRGFWDGYYMGQRLGEWSEVYGSRATKTKVYLGKVLNFFSKINVAEIKLETAEELNVGDEILITGTTTGALQQTVDEIREDLKSVPKVVQGSLFSIKTNDVVRRGDKLYRIVDTQFASCE